MSIWLLYHLVGLTDSTKEVIGHIWKGILKAIHVPPKVRLIHSSSSRMYSCYSQLFLVIVCSIEESALSSSVGGFAESPVYLK